MLFVGLGNPGRRYANTRHNVGFQVVNAFAKSHGWPWKDQARFHAETANGDVKGKRILLAMPTTYMNLSGQAVRSLMDYYQIPLQELVVIVDDAAIPVGEFRIRASGSAGGHNGLKSIETQLGSKDYLRLRIGIGSPPLHYSLEDFVLEDFSGAEKSVIQDKIIQAVEILERLCSEDSALVMNTVNKKFSENGKGEKENEAKESKTL